MSKPGIVVRELRIGADGDQFGVGFSLPLHEEQIKAGFAETPYASFFHEVAAEDGSQVFTVLQSLWGFNTAEREAGIISYVNTELAPKLGEIVVRSEIIRLDDDSWTMFKAAEPSKSKPKKRLRQAA